MCYESRSSLKAMLVIFQVDFSENIFVESVQYFDSSQFFSSLPPSPTLSSFHLFSSGAYALLTGVKYFRSNRLLITSSSTMESSLERSLEMAAIHSDGLSDKERQVRAVKNSIKTHRRTASVRSVAVYMNNFLYCRIF